MGLLTTESNQMRKSHRVDLPLMVQINDVSYKAKDWSMTGVNLIDFTEELALGQVVESRCVFPMINSAIVLNIKLAFKWHLDHDSGFEFIDLAPQVRRVLRQYIELAIEGNLDSLEDIVGVLTTPAVDTPLNNALTLSDMEQDAMTRHFKSGSKIAVAAGLLFLIMLLATLFYNTTYRVDGIGLISNTLHRVRAPAAGTISRVTIKQDEYAKKGTPLFSVIGKTQQDKTNELRLTIEQLAHQRKEAQQRITLPPGQFTKELAVAVRIRHAEYRKAKTLYAQRILSLKDFRYIANQLQIARIAYARNMHAEQVRLENTEGERLNTIRELDLKLIQANEQLQQLRENSVSFIATTDGRIFHIDAKEGTYVNAGDIVMVLEADVTPDVLLKLPNYAAIKVYVGMPATIELPFNGKKLQADIAAIGYNAVYGNFTPTEEASLNETLIKLTLRDPFIRLPANTRVTVWIKTFQWPEWIKIPQWPEWL